jgi:hypothetical protein
VGVVAGVGGWVGGCGWVRSEKYYPPTHPQDSSQLSIIPLFGSMINHQLPRSTYTDSVYDRLRPYTIPYTVVYMVYTLRIRPYFSVLHGSVLRAYLSVPIYGEIRRKTKVVNGEFIVVNDRIFSVYGRKRS